MPREPTRRARRSSESAETRRRPGAAVSVLLRPSRLGLAIRTTSGTSGRPLLCREPATLCSHSGGASGIAMLQCPARMESLYLAMPGTDSSACSCGEQRGIATAFDVIGDRSAALIVGDLLFGPLCFGELAESCPASAPRRSPLGSRATKAQAWSPGNCCRCRMEARSTTGRRSTGRRRGNFARAAASSQ